MLKEAWVSLEECGNVWANIKQENGELLMVLLHQKFTDAIVRGEIRWKSGVSYQLEPPTIEGGCWALRVSTDKIEALVEVRGNLPQLLADVLADLTESGTVLCFTDSQKLFRSALDNA